MSKARIAILGATGHIAKGLIYYFSQCRLYDLHTFARSPDKAAGVLRGLNCGEVSVAHVEMFEHGEYDVVINCVGIGRPSKLGADQSQIFDVTEMFDKVVVEYLEKHRDSLCINFSSGVVREVSRANLDQLEPEDYYMVAKFNSEAKHRSHSSLNIVDLRVFAYFSRFIDLDAGYFITELISYLKSGKVFVTGPDDMVRDYIHPSDLFSMVTKAIENCRCNDVFDAYSVSPARKFEILDYFKENHGLEYEIVEGANITSVTGNKDHYCSINRKAEMLGYRPEYSSMDSIVDESKTLL